MLTLLAMKHLADYTMIGQKKKQSMQPETLSTPQSLALARKGKLNDRRLENVRSYLAKVARVNPQTNKLGLTKLLAWIGPRDR